jgi:ubiquinone/menaquinone biosynthesis C-methylase UbiE
MSSVPLSSPDTRVAYFDRLAPRYDEVWTNSGVGRMQRDATWRHLDPLVRRGDRILDIGCGTGEDALHFTELGGKVLALDVSPEMVRIARARGVNAGVLPIEELHVFADTFEFVLSNFGGFNCLGDLSTLCETPARLVRPRGFLAMCLMSRFCLWESAYYAVRGKFKNATRRWRGAAMTSRGLGLVYPSSKQIRRALLPGFDLVTDVGVGILVPPSFVGPMSPRLLRRMASVDARIEASKVGRMIGDHRLFIFRRR